METINYKPFWDETIKQFKKSIQMGEFTVWFGKVNFISSSENQIIISTPSQFIKDQIETKYVSKLEEILKGISGINIEICTTVVETKSEPSKTTPEQNISLKSKDNTYPTNNVNQQKQEKVVKKHQNLNPDYTFTNFVISENNSFAANAAIAISNNPGTNYNPYLIYGGVGLGKTHLMEAIGNALHLKDEYNIIFVTAEGFFNDFIEGLSSKNMSQFKKKYRSADVLLIDDIQFFQGKEQMQMEFFNTFNDLHAHKKQMVFTCDRPPSELKNLTERLKSRFEMGLNVDIKPPSYEARLAILKKKLETKNTEISDEVLDLIARNVSSNVRDLESALLKIVAFAEMTNTIITLEKATSLLRDVFGDSRQKNTNIDKIIKITADYFNVSVSDIRSKKRTKKIVLPRHLIMYLAKDMADMSTTEIGEELGGRDHTTVMHGIKKINESILSEPSLEASINELKNKIKEATN